MRKIVATFSYLKNGLTVFDIIDGDHKGELYIIPEEQSPGFLIYEDTSIGRKIMGI